MGKEQVAFNLVVDQKRAKVINLLFSGYAQILPDNEGTKILMNSLKDEGVEEDFLALLDEIGDKVHEFGWCEDPDCENK